MSLNIEERAMIGVPKTKSSVKFNFNFNFQFLTFYCSTKASTTNGLDQMHNCISRVFTTKSKSKYHVRTRKKRINMGLGLVHHGVCNHQHSFHTHRWKWNEIAEYTFTRSPGALLALTPSWRPFRCLDFVTHAHTFDGCVCVLNVVKNVTDWQTRQF